ncbi:MAG: sel1 repeat family protein, partial [Candidatus Adiutrix sp.]|nr:sel1 repeat family protein [Candidatus Adiutrix sp.]
AFSLAEALEKQTVPANGLSPLPLYMQAASAGYGPAALRLGRMYLEGAVGLTPDARQAALWLVVAAENHEAAAGLELGKMFRTADPSAATRWLERADSPEASYLLGELYLQDKRFIEAVSAFTASADQGYPEANLALGLLNLDNDFGRKTNPREALKYLKIAAQADLPEGSYNLAKMYLAGAATPKDPITAAYWLNRAAVHGHPQAREEYEKLTYNFSVGHKKRLERMIEDNSVPGMQTPVQ